MLKLRPGCGAYDAAQKRALPLLKQRKMIEQQMDNLHSRLMQNDSVQYQLETMKDHVAVYEATRITNDEMKKVLKSKQLDMDKIDALRDEMEELSYEMNELQGAMQSMYGVPSSIDENELMAELEGLEEEIALEQNATPAYLTVPEPVSDQLPIIQEDKVAAPSKAQ